MPYLSWRTVHYHSPDKHESVSVDVHIEVIDEEAYYNETPVGFNCVESPEWLDLEYVVENYKI